MSRGQTLRALVSERLAAAAEDIFVLFERTIAEYEEELCRCKEENQRKQRLLDKVLSPRVDLVRASVQIPPASPSPGLNQGITETPRIKEEPEEESVKQEEEPLPVSVLEFSAVCVKPDETSPFEHREDVHSETERHPKVSADDDERRPFSRPAAQMETEADGDHCNRLHVRGRSSKLSAQSESAPETAVDSEHVPGADANRQKRFSCSVCEKTFITERNLDLHMSRHAYKCGVCNEAFRLKSILTNHMRTHNGKKPYACPVCNKAFAQKGFLNTHISTHAIKKPYSCTVCMKSFASESYLNKHRRRHLKEKTYTFLVYNPALAQKGVLNANIRAYAGEKPFSCTVCETTFVGEDHLCSHLGTQLPGKRYKCSVCEKSFAMKNLLKAHMRIHAAVKFSCTVCSKAFVHKHILQKHMTIHTGEKPFSCTVCHKGFAYKHNLKKHVETHT